MVSITCVLVLVVSILVLPSAVFAWNQTCLDHPVGFGYRTTGGKGGRTVIPKDISELKTYLRSDEALIVDLDKTYDFTDSEGWATDAGCYFQQCGAGFQESLAHAGTCQGRPATEVKYATAGVTELVVRSFKTITSSNGNGAIKGKGLRILNAQNVIIKGIAISDINPAVIWAGDALAFDNVTDVWVHNCTFARIGRQHLVAYQKNNTGVTVSSCLFDGTSSSSAFCDGKHYWLWLFWGIRDEVTLINNRILNTAGRTPHTGGWSHSSNFIHLIGNEFDTNSHTGIEPKMGANILAEGNKFINFTYPIDTFNSNGGFLAMPNSDDQTNTCAKYLQQNCIINTYVNTKPQERFDESVLQNFSQLDQTSIQSARSAVCS